VRLFARIDAAPHPAARVGQESANQSNNDRPHDGSANPMIHQTTLATADTEVEDRSMRVVEWAMALVAAIAAGILAFIR
jgi:hypothetical protein